MTAPGSLHRREDIVSDTIDRLNAVLDGTRPMASLNPAEQEVALKPIPSIWD